MFLSSNKISLAIRRVFQDREEVVDDDDDDEDEELPPLLALRKGDGGFLADLL
jgi:hypothetical protein